MTKYNHKSFVVKNEDKYYIYGSSIFVQLITRFGLKNTDAVVDIGCGSLRIGRHLIPFLESKKYYGVEPEKKYVTEGIKWELSEHMIDLKKPKFSYSPDFDIKSFKQTFDFALATSVFIHCSPGQLKRCLSNLKYCLSKNGKFVFHVKFAEQTSQKPQAHLDKLNLRAWGEDVPYRFSDNCSTVYSVSDLDEVLDTNGFKRTQVFSPPSLIGEIQLQPLMSYVEAKLK
jgi:SAM-dependent methyltransferase